MSVKIFVFISACGRLRSNFCFLVKENFDTEVKLLKTFPILLD